MDTVYESNSLLYMLSQIKCGFIVHKLVNSHTSCVINILCSSAPVIANGPTGGPEVSSSSVSINNSGTAPPPAVANKNSVITFGTGDSHGQPTPSSSNRSASSSSSAVCFSSLDPVLVPSNDPRLPGVVGAIKREVGSNRLLGEPNTVVLAEKKITAGQDSELHSLCSFIFL